MLTAFLVLLTVPAPLAAAVPRSALFDGQVETAVVARAQPKGEPQRALVEYGAALAAFTLFNAAGSAFLSGARVTVSQGGQVSLNGSGPPLAAAGACFVLSPLAGALASWAVGKTSDSWSSPLGWATLGAYGASAVAVGAGLGLAAAGVSRDTAVLVNAALYLAVPLGTVLVQNAGKAPLPTINATGPLQPVGPAGPMVRNDQSPLAR